jgi:pimeloyl-ACP methyl ester carboxylesterase
VADVVGDVVAIADALGLARFVVTGGSGGAPHALACGALLPDRVTRCASVVGPAPFGPGGLPREEYFAGMVDGNVREFGWALEGEERLRPELEREAQELLFSIDNDAENPLGPDYALSSDDVEAIGHGGIRQMLSASLHEGIGRSIDGMVDDDLAFVRPWGFDVSRVCVPAAVWYGPHDTLVPTTHGEWLARHVPGAEVVLLGGGHFAVYEQLPQLLAWLTDGW